MDFHHWMTQSTVLALACLGGCLVVAAFSLDYAQWKAFGQGSPPGIDTWHGFAILRAQDLLLWLARRSNTEVVQLRAHTDKRRFLTDLPMNARSRPPLVRWHAPQRVKPGGTRPSEKVQEASRALLAAFVDEHAARIGKEQRQLQLGTSRLEGKGQAVFVAEAAGRVNAGVATMFREIFHIHGDLSFHTLLAPADAAEVVEKGWGERFGLAGRKALTGRRKGCILPEGMVLIYPLREMSDLRIVESIVQAALDHALAV